MRHDKEMRRIYKAIVITAIAVLSAIALLAYYLVNINQ